MQRVLLSSVVALSLTTLSTATFADGNSHRWNKGPFGFFKRHFQEFNELVDIVEELADSQPDIIDMEAYHIVDNNLDRHYVDQNSNNTPGKCDQRLVKHRWDGADQVSQQWIDTNSITGQVCGYTFDISFAPLSEGNGLVQTGLTLPEIPGYQQTHSPGIRHLKAKTRVGESWGEYTTISTSVGGNQIAADRTLLRTSTLLSKHDSVTVPAGTFEDCLSVSSKEEATQADGSVAVIAQNISYVCRNIGTVRRVQMVGGYDFQLTSLVSSQ